MAPRKKHHSKELRSLIVKHHQNGDSHLEVSSKVLLPRETILYIVRKYKETKCIGNVFGRVRKRKTTATMDRLIVCRIKSNRRSSAHKVKTEIESALRISLNVNTILNRVHEAGLFGRVALKKIISQQGQLEKAVEVLERHAEQTSWILGNNNLVRQIKVQALRVKRNSIDVANA